MALIKCKECGKEISDKAKVCVNCGNPIFQEKVKTIQKKKWEELTKEEKNKIVAYRKIKKEWWNSGSRATQLVLTMFVITFGLLAIVINNSFAFLEVVVTIPAFICSLFSMKEQKIWYEKNIDRLYEDEILK